MSDIGHFLRAHRKSDFAVALIMFICFYHRADDLGIAILFGRCIDILQIKVSYLVYPYRQHRRIIFVAVQDGTHIKNFICFYIFESDNIVIIGAKEPIIRHIVR